MHVKCTNLNFLNNPCYNFIFALIGIVVVEIYLIIAVIIILLLLLNYYLTIKLLMIVNFSYSNYDYLKKFFLMLCN